MSRTILKQFFILCFLAGMILTSCNRIPERRHPLVLKAKKNIEQGNYPEAARLYEEYLIKNPKSCQIHQEAASLYFDYLNDPLMASYHYRQSIKYLPKKENDKHLKDWLKEAEKKHFDQLKNDYSDATTEKVKELNNKLFESEKQNEKFRRYLAYIIKKNKEMKRKLELLSKSKNISLADINLPPKEPALSPKTEAQPPEKTVEGKSAPKGSLPKTPPPQPVIPEGSTFYVIKSGDNLMKISKKVYGTSKHYKLIYEANRGILPSASKLSLGQKLVIPPLSKD